MDLEEETGDAFAPPDLWKQSLLFNYGVEGSGLGLENFDAICKACPGIMKFFHLTTNEIAQVSILATKALSET